MTDRLPLQRIKSFSSLVKYLRNELDWPIESDDFDELTFDFEPEELGLKPEDAAKVRNIKQLRPLTTNQPWGIFFVGFEPKRLPIVALRKILSSLVIKKRASANRSERVAWQLHDLLFVSSYGEDSDRQITLAYFAGDANGHAPPTLKVLGWDELDTKLNLQHIDRQLHERLRWPDDADDHDQWRRQWSAAFVLGHRHAVRTAKELAEHLADLAKSVQAKAAQSLDVEAETGPLRRLYAAFREALIHDLSEDDFADMYAQTITYGLFSAAVSRTDPEGGTAVTSDSLVDMVPITNPFLRETLATFLTAGGRKGALDFDELGIQDVVELLNAPETDLAAVLRNFGDLRQGEDPVIHLYEDFLKQYDRKRKVERGVFYTPQPVVSYIVRSVHELLQSEFGLEDGLASTVTWGEMAQAHDGLAIPKGAKPDDPFVVILDPATGTATFLVEVIDVIHKTMIENWKRQKLSKTQRNDAWNEYVPRNLLPRLYGYELMMAPYAIAHMKIGLKLHETGYNFLSDERARVYLTNALEPPQEFSGVFEQMAPALAHEAQAVNHVKRQQRFTVVIGNPPYSKISSNLTPEMRATVERYRYVKGNRIKERGALQFEINLQDDYVKFFRFCEKRIETSRAGLLGIITNNGYLSSPTLRGMRDSLLETFNSIWITDLHGHLAKGEVGPDGQLEENVFDILQGVAVCLGLRFTIVGNAQLFHADQFGSREEKYEVLQARDQSSMDFSTVHPSPPFYLFVPHDVALADEWKRFAGLTDLFPRNSAGIITARDGLVIAHDREELRVRLKAFSTARGEEELIYEKFGFSKSKRFDLLDAQDKLRKLKSFDSPIRRLLHRPFDERHIFFHPAVVWSLSRPMAEQMVDGQNLALIATRQVTRPHFEHVFVSKHMIEIKACSHDRNTQIFPLFIRPSNDGLPLSTAGAANLDPRLFMDVAHCLQLKPKLDAKELGRDDELTPRRLFGYIYAILHSPTYRECYFQFLRSDFPRVPVPRNPGLFTEMTSYGGNLASLHLMESPLLQNPITTYTSPTTTEVEKITYADNHVWLDKKRTCGFAGVPETVWNFRIGGYQVCYKWLKDRKGRTLSEDDIAHYQKIVVALSATIRLMREIDEVIDRHGGWPAAFVTEELSDDAEVDASFG